MQGWWLLAVAVTLEVAGTTCMKLSDGFTRLWPSLGIVVFYLASFACLTLALKRIDVSIAYAIWAGLGIVLITFIGVSFFDEPMTLWRAGCIALVLIGVIGLNLSHS
ncbi:cation/cationic drug transporter [Salinisphaera dokdonensis CL-ES53]|uniref:Cation/cationic drug transporter n=1 Tax=Salinisphaera dokdonensis CL-ES53 TaxID=1304272 RepID=A0ABV2AXX0_9GAMM